MTTGTEARAAVEFGVLGPLRVVVKDASVALPAKQRVLLAMLLLQANEVVSVSTLARALWDDGPPAAARNTLQGYVMRLRQNMGEAGGRVITRDPGYLISVADGELDLARFTAACDRARDATTTQDWATASSELRAALALWRGDSGADLPSASLRRGELARVAELRLQALEWRIDADLRLGRHDQLVPELRQLADDHPLRERFWEQLMLALYRNGRQAEAVASFRRARALLREELGIDPSPGLHRLHQQILAADPALATASHDGGGRDRAASEGLPTAVAPAQLPPDAADFTGREEQVRLLSSLLGAEPDPDRPGAVVLSAVAGMGGIGKTALAVHVAHRLRHRFSDGQLYVNLQSTGDPLRPADVLAMFLRDLGLPDAAVPASEPERTARYRTLLSGRKLLVVLDDARDATQVRPLLPGSASCAVVVTSRNALPDLTGAVHLQLDALPPDEARALFTVIAGGHRTAAEPDATTAVLASCAGLPLAIRIAASRVASRPGWCISRLSARLADEGGRLGELAVGDLAVRTSFAVSYHALPAGGPDPARVFRLFGMADAALLSLPAVAALTGQPPAQASAALETLLDAHLLESPAADRYRLHDLLRCYAVELGEATEPPQERDAAARRVTRWYGEQAVAAARALGQPASRLPVVVPSPSAVLLPMASPAQALDWFATERVSLVSAARRAAETGDHDIAAQIPAAMWEFFQRTSYADDWLAVSQIGVASARHLGDDVMLSWLLNGLGQVQSLLGQFTPARQCLDEALAIRRRAGDRSGEAKVLNSLAIDLFYQDRFEDALGYLRAVMDIYAELGEQDSIGMTLNNLGHGLLHLKRHGEAIEHLERGLAIRRETGNKYGEGMTELTLAETYLALISFEEAADHYGRARAALQETAADHIDHAEVLLGLGDALAALNRTAQAREAWQAAIPILDRFADPRAAQLRQRLSGQ